MHVCVCTTVVLYDYFSMIFIPIPTESDLN